MGRLLVFLYGMLSYAVFLVAFLYAIGFVGNILVPKSIDGPQMNGMGISILINALLLGLFAIQHTIMARPGFKKVLARIIPRAAERSTFVLLSSLILLLMYWQWRPLPAEIWTVQNEVGRLLLNLLFWFGWFIVFVSTFLIDHFDLFGLRQVTLHLRGKEYTAPKFQMTGFYRYVRHPIMLGFVIAFWATPHMTFGHLLFALATTGYILVGIQFEERDLAAAHGETYAKYKNQVSMLLPLRRGEDIVPPESAPEVPSPAHGSDHS